jgi:hypothetical protein
MRTALCIVSSDWHLERNAWVRYPDLSGDAYFGLEQIIDLCTERHLPLIAAGDLFDKPYPDSRSVWEAMRQMDRMENYNLKVLYIQGQHERSRDKPWMSLHEWPQYIHQEYKPIKGLNFYGLDYTRPDHLKSALQACDNQYTNILVCHQVWGNFMGTIRVTDGMLEQVPLHDGVIITGDYHKHVNLEVTAENGCKNVVLSPGSICLQSVDEPPDKAVYVLYDDLTFESIPLKSRNIFRHELLKKQDLEDLLATIGHSWLDPQIGVPDNIAKPILSVRYDPDIPDAYTRLVNDVKDRAHLFARPIGREMDEKQVEVGEAQQTIDLGLEGNLAKLCLPGSITYAIARRLLTCTNPKTELTQIETEYLNGELAHE